MYLYVSYKEYANYEEKEVLNLELGLRKKKTHIIFWINTCVHAQTYIYINNYSWIVLHFICKYNLFLNCKHLITLTLALIKIIVII